MHACLSDVCLSPHFSTFLLRWQPENRGDICPWDPWFLSLPPATILASHCALVSHAWSHEGQAELGGRGRGGGRVKQSGVTGFFCDPTDLLSTRAFRPLPWSLTSSPMYLPPISLSAPLLWPRQPLTSGHLRPGWWEAGEKKPAALF